MTIFVHVFPPYVKQEYAIFRFFLIQNINTYLCAIRLTGFLIMNIPQLKTKAPPEGSAFKGRILTEQINAQNQS